MLNQKERDPLSVADQVASIYAGTGGYLDRIKTDRVQEFLDRLLSGLHSEQGDLMKRINDSGELSDEDEKALGDAIDDFGPNFDEEGQPLEEGESDRVREHRDEEEEKEEDEDREEAEDQEQEDSDREEVPA